MIFLESRKRKTIYLHRQWKINGKEIDYYLCKFFYNIARGVISNFFY